MLTIGLMFLVRNVKVNLLFNYLQRKRVTIVAWINNLNNKKMKITYLDNEIILLEGYKKEGTINHYQNRKLAEYKQIKQLLLHNVSQRSELLERLEKIENWCYNKANNEDLDFLNKIFRSENCG